MFEQNADTDEARVRFSRRAVLFAGLQAAGFGVLSARLYQLQVLDQSQYKPLADANRTTRQTLTPLRGRILDRHGRVLADTEEYFRAVLTPSLAGDVGEVLDRLERIRPMDEDWRRDLLKRIARQPSRLPTVVAEDLTWREISSINLNAPILPGIHTEIGGRRKYYLGGTMSRIVGYVGKVERFALDDDPVLRQPDMRIGKAGIERVQDARLRGEHGYVVRELDSRGRIQRSVRQVDPRRGQDVVLTIDTDLQERVLRRLSRYRRSAAVVIDIPTGDVVAMGSVPYFDVARLSDSISAKAWARVRRARDNPLIDRSVKGLYPPGSTFKMVTALAALEAGLVGQHEHVNCTGRYTLSRQHFRCWNRGGHGPCDLKRAIKESCDVYFYEVARRLGIERLAEMARRFSFGQDFGDTMVPMYDGIVPDPEWKRGRFGRGWYGGETLLAAIGQGYMLATPMHLAVMTARLATGRAVRPSVVRRDAADMLFPSLGINPRHLRAVQSGMWAAVNEAGGTAKEARLEDAALRILGKTGTSQVARISSRVAQSRLRWNLRDHALFVGYVADAKPRYAIAAIVEHGESGGKTAAPLVRAIAEDVISIDPGARPVFALARRLDDAGSRGRP